MAMFSMFAGFIAVGILSAILVKFIDKLGNRL